MREFVVSEAPLDRVAALAQATVEDLGGVVAHHSGRTTEFDHLREEEGDWSRSGYIGTYQRYKEDPVRIRVRLWASWPRKLFYWSIWLGLIEAVVLFTMSIAQVPPPPNVWILSAILTFALIGTTFLMYSTSWADSADLEDALARKLTTRLLDDEVVEGDIYTIGEWEEHRAEVVETAVERAKEQAPERPSRAKQVVQSIGASGGERASGLVQRFRSTEDEADEATATEAHDDEAEDAAQTEEEAEPEPESEIEAKRKRLEELKQARSEEVAAEEDEGGLVDRLAFWRSSKGDGDEDAPDAEPPEVPEATDQPPSTEEEPDDGDDEGGLVDRLAFWRSSEEDGDDEAPDERPVSPGDAAAEEDEPPEGEPEPHEGDAHAEETDAPDALEEDAQAEDENRDAAARDA